jgi:hypothetical protein
MVYEREEISRTVRFLARVSGRKSSTGEESGGGKEAEEYQSSIWTCEA